MNSKVVVLGAGSWGTANAIQLAKKGLDTKLWVRNKESLMEMQRTRENKAYLPGIPLPETLTLTDDLAYACEGANVIVLGTPSHAIRQITNQIKPLIKEDQVIVSLAKGIENETLLRMSEIIEGIVPNNKIAVLSGPSHAEELGKDMPTTVVVSAKDRNTAEYIQEVFMSNPLRVYTNADLIGVELGGALKNIIALGIGVIDGLGYGDNTKAAIMTRGIVEIARLGEAMGANKDTFAGLAGIGDLIVTCTSPHSRNRRAGVAIGQGQTLEQVVGSSKMVVEGVRTTKSAHDLSIKLGVDMPITNEIYKVIYEGNDVKDALKNLMSRNKKHETEDLSSLNNIKW